MFVVPHLLLLLRYDQSCASSLHVVAEGFVQPVNVVGILWHIVRLAHEVVNEGVRKLVTPGLPNDLDGLVDCLLANLQVELQGMSVLPWQGAKLWVPDIRSSAEDVCFVLAQGVMLGGLREQVPLLVVPGNGNMLLRCAPVAQAPLKSVHLVVALGEAEGLVVVARQHEELHGAGEHIALLPAVLRDANRTLAVLFCALAVFPHALRFPHQLEGLLGFLKVVQAEAHDAIQVTGALIGHQGFPVGPARLLGLGVLVMKLRRQPHLVHQRCRCLEVKVLDVEGGGLVEGASLFVELGGLDILLHFR
mmetsp:Transcript_67041/g.143439  ORF Transcript_67041/g.143439 Transcript_67041/m.143439 type:complete len:305 (-) Transcript_67041:2692-3606(-)